MADEKIVEVMKAVQDILAALEAEGYAVVKRPAGIRHEQVPFEAER